MKKTLASLVVLFAIVAPITLALAEDCDSSSTKLCNPIKYDTFTEFVSGVTEAAVTILLPFVAVSFIYTGFLFVQAQGKPEAIKAAQMALWYSAIGALILFGAYGFSQVIKTTVETVTGTSATNQ